MSDPAVVSVDKLYGHVKQTYSENVAEQRTEESSSADKSVKRKLPESQEGKQMLGISKMTRKQTNKPADSMFEQNCSNDGGQFADI